MTTHPVVSHEAWLAASRDLLAKEKEFTRLRDELSRERRTLPWERVEKDYSFETAKGPATLTDLFGGHGQLLVYHFMFGPDWTEGCKNCSFWADNFNGIDVHLAHRDTALVVVSRAPLATLQAYRKRMGWSFRWVSSGESDFNFDYKVSSSPGEDGVDYNFGTMRVGPGEMPGLSAFRRGDDGAIYHTYSTYARGIEMLNSAYHLLDLTSKGRDEAGLPFTMSWVKRRDQY
jgi:predicted dithiol-disulfide oxidoreductase (DUF899 family)